MCLVEFNKTVNILTLSVSQLRGALSDDLANLGLEVSKPLLQIKKICYSSGNNGAGAPKRDKFARLALIQLT